MLPLTGRSEKLDDEDTRMLRKIGLKVRIVHRVGKLEAERMQQIITAKLKLETTTEQLVQLRQTQLAYRDALNFVSRYAFEHGKVSSTADQGIPRGVSKDWINHPSIYPQH